MVTTAFKNSKAKTPPKVPDSVIQFVAQHIRSNVRELEGALLKVVAYAALQNGPITLSLAKDILADHVERCDPMVHLSTIESTVATYFGTTPAVLHSSKKDKTVSLARHFSMYLARKHTQMSSSEIGRLMGNKNHATVLVACKKIEDMLRQDSELHWCGPTGNRVARAKVTLMALETNLST
jgi:chromosomal replication initiator protein